MTPEGPRISQNASQLPVDGPNSQPGSTRKTAKNSLSGGRIATQLSESETRARSMDVAQSKKGLTQTHEHQSRPSSANLGNRAINTPDKSRAAVPKTLPEIHQQTGEALMDYKQLRNKIWVTKLNPDLKQADLDELRRLGKEGKVSDAELHKDLQKGASVLKHQDALALGKNLMAYKQLRNKIWVTKLNPDLKQADLDELKRLGKEGKVSDAELHKDLQEGASVLKHSEATKQYVALMDYKVLKNKMQNPTLNPDVKPSDTTKLMNLGKAAGLDVDVVLKDVNEIAKILKNNKTSESKAIGQPESNKEQQPSLEKTKLSMKTRLKKRFGVN
jgi:hypothetical protein